MKLKKKLSLKFVKKNLFLGITFFSLISITSYCFANATFEVKKEGKKLVKVAQTIQDVTSSDWWGYTGSFDPDAPIEETKEAMAAAEATKKLVETYVNDRVLEAVGKDNGALKSVLKKYAEEDRCAPRTVSDKYISNSGPPLNATEIYEVLNRAREIDPSLREFDLSRGSDEIDLLKFSGARGCSSSKSSSTWSSGSGGSNSQSSGSSGSSRSSGVTETFDTGGTEGTSGTSDTSGSKDTESSIPNYGY